MRNRSEHIVERLERDLSEWFVSSRRIADGFYLVGLNLHCLFVGLEKPVYCMIIDSGLVVSEIRNNPFWLDSQFGAVSPRVDKRAEFVPIILAGDNFAAATQALATQLVGSTQPLLDSRAFVHGSNIKISDLKRELLRKCHVRHLMPYHTDVPAPQGLFVGRDAVVEDLIHSRGNSIIVGPRRIGKTSVAQAVSRKAGVYLRPEFGIKSGGRPMMKCAYVDVSEESDRVSFDVWTQILRAFGLEEPDYRAGGRIRRLAESQVSKEWVDQLDHVKALRSVLLNLKGELTILLDEVDWWLEQDARAGWPSMNTLRAITDQGRAKVILVGYENLSLAAEDHRFPLAARGNTIRLGQIDRAAMESLVTNPMEQLGIEIDRQEEFLNRLWETTSGMPHLIQDIAHELVVLAFERREGLRKVGMKDLADAIKISSAVRTFQKGVLHCDFPLAELAAGISSLSGQSSSGEVGPASNVKTLNQSEIMRRLEEHGVQIESLSEMRLAFRYLELRFVLQSADVTETSWIWRNELARQAMESAIRKTGFERWLSDVNNAHQSGEWRKQYSVLGQGV